MARSDVAGGTRMAIGLTNQRQGRPGMGSVFSKILCPVDLDGSSPSALRLAGDVARACGGEVHVLHVIPMVLSPAAMPTYVNLYRGEGQELAKARLAELASRSLGSVTGESKTVLGEPAAEILAAAKRAPRGSGRDGNARPAGIFEVLPRQHRGNRYARTLMPGYHRQKLSVGSISCGSLDDSSAGHGPPGPQTDNGVHADART